MIPADWIPVHRDDGELVGYLRAAGELVEPLTLLGTPLGTPSDEDSAREVLDATGLAVLADRWWCRLPAPVIVEQLDASAAQPEWDWRTVVLIESTPSGCRIRPLYPWPEEQLSVITLPVPVGDLLLRRQPE